MASWPARLWQHENDIELLVDVHTVNGFGASPGQVGVGWGAPDVVLGAKTTTVATVGGGDVGSKVVTPDRASCVGGNCAVAGSKEVAAVKGIAKT